MWVALCDLSRGVVEDAVKAAGGGKRWNFGGLARSFIRVSPLRANDLTELANLVVQER